MTHASNRRTFMLQVITATSAAAAPWAMAADEPTTVKLTEADPYARSMGFRLDTHKVDQAKYPRHDAATQQCSKCQLYSGAPGAAEGPCSFYGGRLVPVTGWCRNFKVRQA
jgi:hypothetical protein